MNPKLVNAEFSKATCLNKLGRFEKAIESYNRAFDKEDGGGYVSFTEQDGGY